MTKEGIFLVFCLEIYRYAKGMSGSEVMALFEKYHIDDYVVTYYEALHTTGEKYIVQDIDLYIAARQ